MIYEQAVGRIQRVAILLAIAGTAAATVKWGIRGGAGFLMGSVLSILNLGWWKRLVSGINHESSPPGRGSAVLMGGRYLMVGAGVYVIVKFLEVSLVATLAGLLTAVAAVLLELLFELLYART